MALGIKMIELYEGMVRDYFEPVESMLKFRTARLTEAVTVEVKKDFGIYDLYVEKESHILRIKEIEELLEKYEEKQFKDDYRRSVNMIDEEVERRLMERDGIKQEIKETKDALINEVRLSGAVPEIKKLFETLSVQMKGFADQIAALPPVTEVIADIEEDA